MSVAASLFAGRVCQRMFEPPSDKEVINPSKIRECLKTKILGQPALYFRQLTSTNDIAKQLAARGLREGALVVTETQTSGKGRLGRRWISPEGGFWFSAILRPKVHPRHAAKLTLLASVAVAKTVSRLYGLNAEIKWPNDILVNRRKVCGILTEGEIEGNTLTFAILGVGINANFTPEVLPRRFRDSGTTLMEQLGEKVEREALLCELLREIEYYYQLFTSGKHRAILDDWRRLAIFMGFNVEIVSDGEKIRGLATGVDDDGALIVRLENHTVRRFTAGEITAMDIEDPRWVDE